MSEASLKRGRQKQETRRKRNARDSERYEGTRSVTRSHVACFWTWPFGHVWSHGEYGMSCENCGATRPRSVGA